MIKAQIYVWISVLFFIHFIASFWLAEILEHV